MQDVQAFISTLDECSDFILIMKVEQVGIYTYYYANRYAIEMGNFKESSYGKRIEDVLRPNRAKYLIEKYNECISLNKRVVIENTVHLLNGNILGEAIVTPVIDQNGECSHLTVIAKNILEKRLKEEELFRANKLLDSFIDSSADGIIVLDYNNKVTWVNNAFLELFGYEKEEILYLQPTVWQSERDHKDFLSILKYVKQGKELRDYETKRLRKDGTELDISVTYSPYRSSDGKIIGVICFVRNISERLKDNELIRNLDRLSIIGQLAAGVAHEIRNPLTALKGFSRLLQSTLMSPDQRRYINIMLDELERIELIVNEFMTLAKPEAIEFQEACIQELILSTVTVFETQAHLHNVLIECSFSQSEPIVISCQPNQLKQVFMNFLKNAIEAMASGGKMEISLKIEGEYVVISFKDNGIGIPEDRLKHLGTPFYTTKEKGIGLGLTISNKIIKEHEGEMNIHSKLNHGTTINVSLPLLTSARII
ncbi:ATP-binding protein [Bacillus sp. PS06]|uniref:ATP-binding protein n=1 Tax=Bacillus sp. PS06 TaxID=2764176 RepID=UPI0017862219|nr:ATP-binding protein [Bacillus sp. PS06]MBD8067455.1 PAS domain S-box protein [Bacillus sp. PS06]